MTSDRDLRAAVEALADEWDREDERDMTAGWASDRLRAILAEHPATPAEPDAGGEAQSLAALFDNVRAEHQIDVMQSNLLACTCGESLPIVYDDEGQPLYNPAIRHHHEQYAKAVAGLRLRPTPEPDAGGEGVTEDEREALRERLASWFGEPRQAFLVSHIAPAVTRIVADRERRAEARGAERALREAADEIETTDGGISRGSVIRVGALADAARHLRDRADRIAGEGQ